MEHYSLRKKTRAAERALKDWHGAARAGLEIMSFRTPVSRVGDHMDKILEKLAPPDMLKMTELAASWAEVAGAQIAKISSPARFESGVLRAEVTHSMWLRELGSAAVKGVLINNVNKFFGKDVCLDIVFLPPGGGAFAPFRARRFPAAKPPAPGKPGPAKPGQEPR